MGPSTTALRARLTARPTIRHRRIAITDCETRVVAHGPSSSRSDAPRPPAPAQRLEDEPLERRLRSQRRRCIVDGLPRERSRTRTVCLHGQPVDAGGARGQPQQCCAERERRGVWLPTVALKNRASGAWPTRRGSSQRRTGLPPPEIFVVPDQECPGTPSGAAAPASGYITTAVTCHSQGTDLRRSLELVRCTSRWRVESIARRSQSDKQALPLVARPATGGDRQRRDGR